MSTVIILLFCGGGKETWAVCGLTARGHGLVETRSTRGWSNPEPWPLITTDLNSDMMTTQVSILVLFITLVTRGVGSQAPRERDERRGVVLTDAERDVGVGELARGGEREEAVEAQAEGLDLLPAAVHLLDDVAEALGPRLVRGGGVGAARGRRRARVPRREVHAVRQLAEVVLALGLQRARSRRRLRHHRRHGAAPRRHCHHQPPPRHVVRRGFDLSHQFCAGRLPQKRKKNQARSGENGGPGLCQCAH
jgi:hypothetical protein